MIYFVRRELRISSPEEFMRLPVKWATILMEQGVIEHREAERAAKERPRTDGMMDADKMSTADLIQKLGPGKNVAVEVKGKR